MLRGLGERVRFIRGNAERELVEPDPPRPGGPPPGMLDEQRAKLTDEQIAFAYGVPEQQELEIEGLGRVLFCHATPRNDIEIVTPASSEARLREVLAEVEANVVVVGHTHMQDDRVVDGIRFVNAGSVGMPYEDEPGAYWALLGPDVEMRLSAYDAEAAAARFLAAGGPAAGPFAERVVDPPPAETAARPLVLCGERDLLRRQRQKRDEAWAGARRCFAHSGEGRS